MLNLPIRLHELLRRDHALHSFVLGAAATIGPWARDNKTVFFPEYTDHSLVHLNEVIATADSLISDEAWLHLTAEDAAALVASVLLHDSALHLSEDGFFELNSPPAVIDYAESRITVFGYNRSRFSAAAEAAQRLGIHRIERPGQMRLGISVPGLNGHILHRRVDPERQLPSLPARGTSSSSIAIRSDGSAGAGHLDRRTFTAEQPESSLR